MRLQWEPSLETLDSRYHEAMDEVTGITAVVEWDGPSRAEPWIWYLANYPVVSREPIDREGPAGRAPTKEAAMEAVAKALPTPEQSVDLLKQEARFYESEF